MRTRIALAIIGTAVAALVVAAALTLAVLRVTGRAEAEERVADQTEALAAALTPEPGERTLSLRSPTLARLGDALDVEELTIVVVLPDGTIRGAVPEGVPQEPVVVAADTGEPSSDADRGRIWAVAPVGGVLGGPQNRPNVAEDLRGGIAVVVASDPAPTSVPPGVRSTFAIVALLTLVAGAGVALLLARGLTRPLRRAEDAAHRIAAGDLSARAPVDGGPAEIVDLARSVNEVAEGLERSRALERQFLLSVSHDLRTPLTSVRGWSEAIADGTAPDPARAAAIIGSEARRLDRLVGDLLDLGRLEARQFSLVAVTTPVGPLVGDVVAGLAPDAATAGITVVLDDRSDGAAATVDPDRLGQVVANLVENALKFAGTRVVATVEVGHEDVHGEPSVEIAVGDDGPGIAPIDLPHVFERLYVSRHRPSAREAGSGLGLAIVRELVTAMGGSVEARSPAADGQSTELRVRLPLVAAAAP